MRKWVVGSGGLLGSALCAQLGDVFTSPGIPWTDPESASRTLRNALGDFVSLASSEADQAWAIYWTAGAAVVSSPEAQIALEEQVFQDFVTSVRSALPKDRGSFFLASSAGGVYAGSSNPPFSYSTPPEPVGSYGKGKLRLERFLETELADHSSVVIGRIANLYGPGQSLAKQQGLVFSLCRAAAHRQPLSIYVPMETLRDYIYVEDAAAQIDCFVQSAAPGVRQVVIASGEALSISSLIATAERVTGRRIPISAGENPSAKDQVLDLRLIPTALPIGCTVSRTDLPTGIRRTFNEVVRQPTVLQA